MNDLISLNDHGTEQNHDGAKMNFMAVFTARDLSTLKCDGILGLSPKEVNPKDPHRVQLFVR